jgi:antitoxin VapB
MPRALNVKNPEAHRLARELATLTGETLTEAVRVALGERLVRERASREGDLADRLLSIGRDCAGRLRAAAAAGDPSALLHDDAGLPR